ncbi:MAG: TonB-dependent receptor [Gemmatimonadota bacterium]
MTRFRATLLIITALLIPGSMLAQTSQTGAIQGTVLSTSGEPMQGVQVESAQPDGSYRQTTLTNEDGRFRIAFLPPGEYNVEFISIGYRTTRLEGVTVRVGDATTVEIEMGEEAIELDPITVAATAQLIDKNTSAVSTRIDKEAIDVLPAPRVATSLLQFVPGVRPGQVWGGSTSQANSYMLDGVNVNDPGFGGDFLLPNVDWIEDFHVRGLGAGAEYGNFQGGLINIVTKTGNNTFQGGVRFNYEDADLNASNINLREVGAEQARRWEVNAEARGPILRDKLYYYASVQELRTDYQVVDAAATGEEIVFQPQLEERREFKALGKLTWQATQNDIFNLSVGKDDVFVDNDGLGSYDMPAAASREESPATFGNISWQRSFTGGDFLQLKVTGYAGEFDILPYHGNTPAVRLLSSPQYQYANATYRRDRAPKNVNADLDYDIFFDIAGTAHHVKVGGTYGVGWWDEERRRNGGFTWRPDPGDGEQVDPDDPSTWGFISSDWGVDINLHARSVNSAAFIQDYVQLSDHVGLNAGLRVGYWEGWMQDSVGVDTKVASDVGLAPRLGATVDLFGDERWVAKTHWGRYYQSMFALMFDRWEGADVFTDLEYWDWAGTELPDPDRVYTIEERDQYFEFWSSQGIGSEVGPIVDYSQPFMDQWMVSLEHAFGDGWKTELLYVNRQNKDILALVDRNLASNYTRIENVLVWDWREDQAVIDQDGDPLVLPEMYISNDDIQYVGGATGLPDPSTLSYDPDLVITNTDEAERTYHQVQLNVHGRMDWLSGMASVAWTDLTGNFFTVNGYASSGGTGAGAFVRPNEQVNFHGALGGYSDWEFKLNLSADLPAEFRAGVFSTYYSGDHYTPYYSIDDRDHDFFMIQGADTTYLDPDLLYGVAGEDIYLEERGSRTYPGEFVTDLHFDRAFRFGGQALVVGLDVFNLFGEDAVRSVKTSVTGQLPDDPTTLFDAVRRRTPPRTLRLTASFRF